MGEVAITEVASLDVIDREMFQVFSVMDGRFAIRMVPDNRSVSIKGGRSAVGCVAVVFPGSSNS